MTANLQIPIPGTPEWEERIEMIRLSLEQGPDAILARMGYANYQAYLNGKPWKAIAKRIRQRDKGCLRCRGTSDEVHHMSYSEAVLKGEDDSELVTLCAGCHDVVEFDDSRVPRSDAEKRRLVQTPENRVDYPRPKVDLRRNDPVYPPEWHRMNTHQRRGWLNEYHWVWLHRKRPDIETRQPPPEYYLTLKAAYEQTKGNVRDDPSPPRKRKSPPSAV